MLCCRHVIYAVAQLQQIMLSSEGITVVFNLTDGPNFDTPLDGSAWPAQCSSAK